MKSDVEIWTPGNYTNFHSHSAHSKLDCLIRVEELVDFCVNKLKSPAVAISDHGNMGSIYELYSATKKWNEKGVPIKPIYGIEFYFVDDMENRDSRSYHHLTCYAMNLQGLQNLMYLTSASYLQGMYGKPRVDWNLLKNHSDGVLGLSGCIIGKIPDLLFKGQELQAVEALNRFKSIFNGNFFLELQPSSLDFQIKINDLLVRFGEKTNTPVVMTTDSHYLEKQDFEVHEAMLCIQTQNVLSNPDRFTFDCPEFYCADTEDILERVHTSHQDSVKESAQQSLVNSQIIVDLCNVELDFKEIYFPKFPVPEKESAFLEYWNRAKKGILV